MIATGVVQRMLAVSTRSVLGSLAARGNALIES